MAEALRLIHPDQRPLLERLQEMLDQKTAH